MRAGRIYYFGCHNDRAGHFFWRTDTRGNLRDAGFFYPDEFPFPWRAVDGVLPPQLDRQPEGIAALHHLDGWTSLAFWDRSVDRRRGCNSVFFFDAVLDFDAALEQARETFPSVFARFHFEIIPYEEALP